MKITATPTEAWSNPKDMETVRRDIAGYGADVEIADGKLIVTIPDKANEDDRREGMITSRLTRHYLWKVETED